MTAGPLNLVVQPADNLVNNPQETHNVKKLVLGAAMLGVLAVACGGSTAPAPAAPAAARTTDTGSTPTAPTSDVPESARAYFEAMASNNPRMLELASPGSPAHSYARIQLGQAEASRAGRLPL